MAPCVHYTHSLSSPNPPAINQNALTLSSYVMKNTHDPSLVILMSAIALSCKMINACVTRAGVANLYGLSGDSINSTGDAQKQLDVMSNEIMLNALTNSGVCSVLVSEENEEPVVIPIDEQGKYCVAFDPLDGSSNIDCNVAVGTIFAVYEKKEGSKGELSDILRSGNDMICAGYCVYSSACELVYAFKGSNVHCFCLDPLIGEFVATRHNMRFPPDGGKKIYSVNEGNAANWDEPIKDAVRAFKSEADPYSLRYVGSMVADVHRTLLYGGCFLYPSDKKSKSGKLRVLYEGFPMAMLIEQAGGVASTGMFGGKIGRILDVVPKHIHDRCPIIMGSMRDLKIVYGCYEAKGFEVPALPM